MKDRRSVPLFSARSVYELFKRSAGPILALSVLLSCLTTAAGDTYVTADDPLASKSYVDKVATELQADMYAKIAQTVRDEIAKQSVGGGTEAEIVYKTVMLTAGQRLMAKSSCEFMLLSGSVKAVCPSTSQTLTDKTSETSVANNEEILKNHYMIIPRGDGRGIVCVWTQAEIMIRGEYEIVG